MTDESAPEEAALHGGAREENTLGDDEVAGLIARATEAPEAEAPAAPARIPKQGALRPVEIEAHIALAQAEDLVALLSIIGRLRHVVRCEVSSFDRALAVIDIATRDADRVLGLFMRLTEGAVSITGSAEAGFLVEARVSRQALYRQRVERRRVNEGPPPGVPERRAQEQRREHLPLLPP